MKKIEEKNNEKFLPSLVSAAGGLAVVVFAFTGFNTTVTRFYNLDADFLALEYILHTF